MSIVQNSVVKLLGPSAIARPPSLSDDRLSTDAHPQLFRRWRPLPAVAAGIPNRMFGVQSAFQSACAAQASRHEPSSRAKCSRPSPPRSSAPANFAASVEYHAGNLPLPLSRVANDALRLQRATQTVERARKRWFLRDGDDGAIFTDESGSRVTPMASTCAFDRIARKAGISTTRLHDLRHTAATTLLVAGVDVRTAAGVLGHVSPSITLSTYAHLLAEAQREAVDRLGERLERLVANGFDEARQPNGNRVAARIEKSLQIQAVSGSANGNRTRLSALKGRCPNR